MKEATTRDDLIQDRGQIYTVLGALEGVGPELSDKAVVTAIVRCIWHILDFLIKRTWGL